MLDEPKARVCNLVMQCMYRKDEREARRIKETQGGNSRQFTYRKKRLFVISSNDIRSSLRARTLRTLHFYGTDVSLNAQKVLDQQ